MNQRKIDVRLGIRTKATASDDYQSYAQACRRWADGTDNAEHRQAFLELAKLFEQLALTGPRCNSVDEVARTVTGMGYSCVSRR